MLTVVVMLVTLQISAACVQLIPRDKHEKKTGGFLLCLEILMILPTLAISVAHW